MPSRLAHLVFSERVYPERSEWFSCHVFGPLEANLHFTKKGAL